MKIDKDKLEECVHGAHGRQRTFGLDDQPTVNNQWEVVCGDGTIIPCLSEGKAIVELEKLKKRRVPAIIRRRPKLKDK